MEEKERTPKTNDQIMDDLRGKAEDIKRRHADTNVKIKKLNLESQEFLDDTSVHKTN